MIEGRAASLPTSEYFCVVLAFPDPGRAMLE